MVSETTTLLRTYFAKLGLKDEIADIYSALHTYGPQTISQLSRTSGIERTRVYRLIAALLESNLIEIDSRQKHGIMRAAPIANVHILIAKKEQELKSLQSELSIIETALSRDTLSSPSSRVQFYQGIDGVKQMFWNQTRTKGPSFSILHEAMQAQTKAAFFERWIRACNEQNLRFRSVVSDDFIKSLKTWNNAHENERLRYWEARYVSAKVFTIPNSTVMYDDVVTYFNWKGNQIFGIEIHNPEIAAMQRQLFQLLWKQGTPLEDA